MKSLIVYAHPYRGSFNKAVLETLTAGLKTAGHEVRVRDLCAQNFDPRMTSSDLEAVIKKTPAADVKQEQNHLAWADSVFFVHPIWWFGMPAALKGYIDRVFTRGFAYEYGKDGPVGLLKGKTAYFINTTGADKAAFENMGMYVALGRTIDDGIVRFCGMDMGGRKYLHAVPSIGDEGRKALLEEVRVLAESFIPAMAGQED